MIEKVVIVIVIALAVWFYMHLRKKHSSVIESSVKPEAAQAISPESAPIVQETLSIKDNEIGEVTDVIPEDSTLRRHYLQNLGVQDGDSEEVVEANVSEEVVAISVPEDSAIEGTVVETSSISTIPEIPEDAVLKRHFIQHLTAEIEASMPDRPTDSTLKRHYDAQLLSSVASRLETLK